MNSTNGLRLRSWIPVAADSDFPIQNLPLGVFSTGGGTRRVGAAIGDHVVDLAALHEAGLFAATPVESENVFGRPALNDFMAKGRETWSAVRRRLSNLLRDGCGDQPADGGFARFTALCDDAALRKRSILPQSSVTLHMPIRVGGFVDFYASKEHATNVGIMFRGKENALMPNWVHLPVAYNGRANTVIESGRDFHRPMGQTKADDAAAPTFGPSRLLDFELEMGFVVGVGSELGRRVSTAAAEDHLFGMVLLNDWSARDIQKWEYQPLGPFLGKSFATTISPWVVPFEVLEPFRVAAPPQDPPVLEYLRCEGERAYDIRLEVAIQSERMVAEGVPPHAVTRTNFRHMYWSGPQMLAHMTVNGCPVAPGDLFGSGTVSGPEEDSRGSMLEICWKGTRPITLPTGEQRKFIADGDTVVMRGWCEGRGYRVGFGECRAKVLPAIE